MFIIIKDLKEILKFKLVSSLDYKGIHIYQKDDDYYIKLDQGYYFKDNTKVKKLGLKSYEIIKEGLYYSLQIYVYSNDDLIDEFNLYENNDVLISKDNRSTIILNDPYLKNYYLLIKDKTIKSNFDFSFNKGKYDGSILKDEDTIEFLGIKIIYFENFLYINGFNIKVRLKKYNLNNKYLKYNYTYISNTYNIYPKTIKFINEPLLPYKEIKKEYDQDYLRNIFTSLTMLVSIGYLGIYNFLNNNGDIYRKISYLLMPLSMALVSIVIPTVIYLNKYLKYKKAFKINKNEYLKYLDEYLIRLKENIDGYIKSNNEHFFDLNKNKADLFYANKKSEDYLKISLGKINKELVNEIDYTNDEDINLKLKEIKKCYLIENFPLFLDLKENKRTNIICKNADKEYFFKKILLELSFKHDYEDLLIAIYSKDNFIFDKIYNLPHLFIGKKRLTLNSKKDLIELDQLKLDKNLILIRLDNIDFKISNPNIYEIYFSTDNNDLLKDSDILIEYLNNTAYILKEEKISFTFNKEEINFNEYFSFLGRLKTFDTNKTQYDNYFLNYDIKHSYQNNDNRLIASFAYKDELIGIDLHEKGAGPHGLIGGATGSGKSELIVSMLLSLCLRYPPDYLNIILIDYKGGGIKESLSYLNSYIPHITATLSNLEDYGFKRLLIALENECKKREELFKKLSGLLNVSIMNLDDYLTYYEETALIKIPHLLIVVDEFAELKKSHNEEIKKLISLCRIGRSLGLHLILCTQKPSGSIDDEIFSNSHFKIALKVFEEKDSLDIIKRKDAAYLLEPGSFYLEVDNSLIEAKSIYLKKDAYNNDPIKISILDNSLKEISTYKSKTNKTISISTLLVKRIIDEVKIKPQKLNYLPNKEKNRYELSKNEIVLGETDDYINGLNQKLAYKLNDNILCLSTRKKEINAILNTLNENKSKTIVIGCKKYKNSYISDSLEYKDEDDLRYLFNNLIEKDNENYTLVIEDLYILLSYSDYYLEALYRLIRRSEILKINLILITSNSNINFKIINAFKNRVIIESNDFNDLINIFGSKSIYEGKSYYLKDDVKTFVPIKLEEFKQEETKQKPLIPKIPLIRKTRISNDLCLLGYEVKNRKALYGKNINIISKDSDLLNRYKKAYGDKFNYYLYERNLRIYDNILWLGEGIFEQNLFIANLKEDLSDEDGIFIKGNNKKEIKIINHV